MTYDSCTASESLLQIMPCAALSIQTQPRTLPSPRPCAFTCVTDNLRCFLLSPFIFPSSSIRLRSGFFFSPLRIWLLGCSSNAHCLLPYIRIQYSELSTQNTETNKSLYFANIVCTHLLRILWSRRNTILASLELPKNSYIQQQHI